MEENQVPTIEYPGEQEAERAAHFQVWKERIHRFFYNIWPGISRFLASFFYLLMRIIRGFVRTAMDELRHGG